MSRCLLTKFIIDQSQVKLERANERILHQQLGIQHLDLHNGVKQLLGTKVEVEIEILRRREMRKLGTVF